MARTEAAFREVNEAIAKTAEWLEAEEATFVCECADPGCAHRVTAELEDYEDVRGDARHFLLAPGHHTPEVEHVVEKTGGYDVVEKHTPVVVAIVRRLDPRAA